MKRLLALAAACSAVAVAGGCGSSSTSRSGTTPSSGTATKPATGTSTSPSPGAAAPPAGRVKIAYRNIMISPATVTITAGTSVIWTDFDASAIAHNVAVQSGPQTFTSPTLGQGSTYTFKFTKPGVYDYICTFHPTAMIGKITVVR